MSSEKSANPFRIHGVVEDEFFTDRASEIARIVKTLAEPSAKLMVYGPRRMGKTSAIVRAIARHEAAGGVAFLADMSTASTLVDVANRVLAAAGRALGRRWKDSVSDFVRGLGVSITLTPDPTSGVIVPSLDVKMRTASEEEQRNSLARTLDALDALARDRNTTIGVVLDEFQEIQRFGGDAAEWHLRGVIQHHQRVSYVLAGSQAHIIERMLDKGRAFYNLADQLEFGPIDAAHLATWIDDRMTNAGVRAQGVGAAIVAAAGPRTRDVVQVARQCFDNSRGDGSADLASVSVAFDDVVAEQEAVFHANWHGLTALKQNVLRAVALGVGGLTTAESITTFGLTSSGAASHAASALVDAGHLVKVRGTPGYTYENPFFRRWVETETAADLGRGATQAPSSNTSKQQ